MIIHYYCYYSPFCSRLNIQPLGQKNHIIIMKYYCIRIHYSVQIILLEFIEEAQNSKKISTTNNENINNEEKKENSIFQLTIFYTNINI